MWKHAEHSLRFKILLLMFCALGHLRFYSSGCEIVSLILCQIRKYSVHIKFITYLQKFWCYTKVLCKFDIHTLHSCLEIPHHFGKIIHVQFLRWTDVSTSQCQWCWYDIKFTSWSSFPFPLCRHRPHCRHCNVFWHYHWHALVMTSKLLAKNKCLWKISSILSKVESYWYFS